MAIPTLTSITPNDGLSYGEYMVRLAGTNFRIPDLISGPVRQESVRVFFAGVQVSPDKVAVYSDTEIGVRVLPEWSNPHSTTYPLAVDVTLENIDAGGNPIVGETATLVGGFTYVMGDIEEQKYLGDLWRLLQKYLMRVLPCPVFGRSHVDYKTDNLDGIPNQAVTPAIYLVGPRRETNADATERIMGYRRSGLERKRLPKAYDLHFDVVGTAPKKRLLDNLSELFEESIRKAPDLTATYHGDTLVIELWITSPPSTTGAVQRESSVQQFQATITFKGVPADSDVTWIEFDATEAIQIIP